MANKHNTLTELFTNIANQIRRINTTTDKFVADDFPDILKELPAIRIVDGRFKIAFDDIKSLTFNAPEFAIFTPTVFEYYGGYWWIGGNDSQGCGYIRYSSDFQGSGTVHWNTIKIHPSRVHPVHALGFDLANGYVWAYGDPSGYSSRSVVRLNNFLNYPTNSYDYNYWTYAHTFTDATTYNNITWAVTGTNVSYNTSADGTQMIQVTHSSNSYRPFRCCMYNTNPVGISTDGYYGYKTSITATAMTGWKQIASGLTCYDVAQMGDYLCVLGTKTDGTYLYYAKGSISSLTWNYRKISDNVVTPIGMAYANNLYVVAYNEGNTSYIWASSAIDGDTGVRGIKLYTSSLFVTPASTDGESICAFTKDNVITYYTVPPIA